MSETDLKRLRWRCRRGMKELDVIFERYLDCHAASMSAGERSLLARFLEESDMDLYAWLTRRRTAADPDYAALVERLLA